MKSNKLRFEETGDDGRIFVVEFNNIPKDVVTEALKKINDGFVPRSRL